MGKVSKQEKRKKEKKKKIKAARQGKHEKNRDRKRSGNILRYGKKITRRQFDAYCYCRMPLARFTTDEIEWYSLFENNLLGLVIRDVADDDYGFLILGRDARKLFRCIDVGTEFFPTPAEARRALARRLFEGYQGKIKDLYPQGDEVDAGFELFRDVVPENQQHHAYKVLKSEHRFEAARNIISEIVNSFVDNDGHYEREFQSVNFQARLWELYLHIYIHNSGFMVNNNHSAPDFEVLAGESKFFIEAVTVNPSRNPDRPDMPPPTTEQEIRERLDDFMPIKFGSPLYSKLCKKYWEKEHVKNNPIILAIHDYHNENAMTWSRTALSDYLYGVRVRLVDGRESIEKIDEHVWQNKAIPSGFFYQDNAEKISAVIFSNQATIPKFNRMGRIAGLGSKGYKMIRTGYIYNPAPEAIHPIPFVKDVDEPDYEESWSDGLVMFHNPRAENPVDPDYFPDISHIFYSEEEGFYGFHQPYDVLGSVTFIVGSDDDEISGAEKLQ